MVTEAEGELTCLKGVRRKLLPRGDVGTEFGKALLVTFVLDFYFMIPCNVLWKNIKSKMIWYVCI